MADILREGEGSDRAGHVSDYLPEAQRQKGTQINQPLDFKAFKRHLRFKKVKKNVDLLMSA